MFLRQECHTTPDYLESTYENIAAIFVYILHLYEVLHIQREKKKKYPCNSAPGIRASELGCTRDFGSCYRPRDLKPQICSSQNFGLQGLPKTVNIIHSSVLHLERAAGKAEAG